MSIQDKCSTRELRDAFERHEAKVARLDALFTEDDCRLLRIFRISLAREPGEMCSQTNS
jgi:hypothetical protein